MYTESTPAIADTRRPHAGKLSPASLIHQSDDRLVTLARSGSERAWAEITRRYRRQLRSYCARFVGPSRAEDAVQQAFLQAFLALRDGSQREIALRAWLYRIAHNCAIDVLRKGTPEYDQLDLEYDGVPQPPTLFEQREDVRRLVARMRDLPDAQRQALAMRELEGRSYEEISAQLGHSGSGVRQLIFRARTALRNSVAAVLPLGFMKGRVQSVPLDCHHVATAVSVPASSGGGIDVVGAATLAVVAVLSGGIATVDDGPRRARHDHQQAVASPSPPATGVAPTFVSGPAVTSHGDARTESASHGQGRHPDNEVVALAAPTTVAAPIATPPAPVVTPPVATFSPAAPITAVTPGPLVSSPPPADDAMRQQVAPPAAPGVGSSVAAARPVPTTVSGAPSVKPPATSGSTPPATPAGVPPVGDTKGKPGLPAKTSPAPAQKPVKAPLKVPPPKVPPAKAQPMKTQPLKVLPKQKPVAPTVKAPVRKSERA